MDNKTKEHVLLDSIGVQVLNRLTKLSDEELREVIRICNSSNEGNCAWFTYRIAPSVKSIAIEVQESRREPAQNAPG